IRHLTLDARISHLGGKEALEGRMPTRMRQGLELAKKKRQAKKEQEAQEAGILMPVKWKVKVEKPRQTGLKTTSRVGKFKNGMLKVSERDIRKVNQIGSQVHRWEGVQRSCSSRCMYAEMFPEKKPPRLQ